MPAHTNITIEELKKLGITPELLNKEYRTACLYEIDRKPILWLVMGNRKRPLVRR